MKIHIQNENEYCLVKKHLMRNGEKVDNNDLRPRKSDYKISEEVGEGVIFMYSNSEWFWRYDTITSCQTVNELINKYRIKKLERILGEDR